MHAVVALASVLVIVSILWFVGVVFELEYPHILETRRVRGGVTLDGRPGITAIAGVLGTSEDRVHVHICSYCRARLSAVPGTTYVQVSAQDDRTHAGYGFAYHRTTNQLVPADDAAMTKFNSLLPVGVILHTVTETGSEPQLRAPEAWSVAR